MKNTTLVIHGDISENTYEFYCTLYPEVPKIFSTWEENERKMKWRNEAGLHSSVDFFIRSERPERFGIYKMGLELRVVAALLGLERVDTKYCIMLRGDEWYSKLDFVEKILGEEPAKIYTTPVFFRKWEVCPFHIGDHVVAGSTENMRLMFGRTMINMVTKKALNSLGKPMPEAAILGRSYMDAKVGESSDWKRDFANVFGMIPLEKLKYYKVVSDESGMVWYSNFGEEEKDFDPAKDGTWERSISRMEDL
jgi:hypothetical protein